MNQQSDKPKFHRKKGGFRLFGLNKQDFIRYFFGGNASLAVCILILICVFLFLQGKNFLPEYHRDLQIARGSGIDLHESVDQQYGDFKRFTGGFIRAYSTEYYYPGRHENDLVLTHESVRQRIEKLTRRERTVLKDLEKQIKERESRGDPIVPAAPDAAPAPEFAIAPEQIEAFEIDLAAFGDELSSLPRPEAASDEVKTKRMALLRTLFEARKPTKQFNPPAKKEKASPPLRGPPLEKFLDLRRRLIAKIADVDRGALEDLDKGDIREAREISEEEFVRIKADILALAEQPAARDRDYPLYQEFVAERDRLIGERKDHAKPLQDLYLGLQKGSRESLDQLWRSVSKHAVDTKTRSQTAATVVNRIRGPFGIYRVATEPKVRAEKLAMILKECATAELFHPGARLFYIASFDSLIQPDLEAFAAAMRSEAEAKALAVRAAAAKLLVALENPTDHDALRTAFKEFDTAGDEAQAAILKMKTPEDLYVDFFHGDEGKEAFEKLQKYLETIRGAVPDYRGRIAAGSFAKTDLSALETAAGEGGGIDSKLAGRLLGAASENAGSNIEFASLLTSIATDCQLPFPYDKFATPLYEAAKNHGPIIAQVKADISAALDQIPADLESPYALREVKIMRDGLGELFGNMDGYSNEIATWRHDKEQTGFGTLTAFVAGEKWTNNSAIQDRYGLLPLLAGSFIISIIAIAVAVPIGISAAIYVNQIAGAKQQAFLKPIIEFIGIIPSIVLGFLGIAVLGDVLKSMSESALLDWMPGLPIISRLNMLTAALLLAFMAIPTMFSLAEDALNNVPQHLRHASLALGATSLQTAFRVVFPAALSGIIAAILLGFGRVIGETMVVLLVAGNRISLPETKPAIEWVGAHPATAYALGIGCVGAVVLGIFVRVKKEYQGGAVGTLAGLFAFFPITAFSFFLLSFATQPSHTMTGIIAQGLGEASVGSTGWQALFMVGLVLFTISLIINYVAQKIVDSLSIERQILKKKRPTTPTGENPEEAVVAPA